MKQFWTILIGAAALATVSAASGQIRLPRLIRDSMILQRGRKIPLWGWASKGEKIRVTFDRHSYRTQTGADGRWALQLPAMPAGGPYSMEIEGKNRITLRDIWIGDVWLCSGQSNMVHQMKLHSIRYAREIAAARYPEIRQFWIPPLTNLNGPQDDLPAGYWKPATPEDVVDFSAVAYFFAEDLYQKYHVPIGIINASVGGTPIEAWMGEPGCADFPAILKTIRQNKDTSYIAQLQRQSAARKAAAPRPTDKGLTGSHPWYDPSYVPRNWRQIGIPGYWEDQGLSGLNGIVWYRKEIEVPPSMAGRPAKVFLGRIVDADALYVNGKEIGHTTYEYPQRRYPVPAGVLRPGKNLFVIRVTNFAGKGGFVPDKPYSLIAGGDTVDLKGYWQYKVGAVFLPQPHPGIPDFAAQNAPTALYNAMIAPLTRYAIKGFVWYQGESNTDRAAEYAKLQPALIADWRAQWKEGDLPFLYVQLPGYGDYRYLPAESQWAELREAQLSSLSVPNTAMAVTIDLGEWNDIHPDRKKPVGDRLALAAEKLAYGGDLVYSGPLYSSSVVRGDTIVLSFTHTGSGLLFKDSSYTSPGPDEVEGPFSIAGPDKRFIWAHAKIVGDQVWVWSPGIKDPKYVRYAWADSPVDPDLYNKEGLPASPFQTN